MKPYAFEIKNGSVGLDTVKLQNVTRKIERLIQKLGRFPFLANIFNNLKVHYYNSTYHRYVFKIPPQDLIGIPKSEFPWNYLILLGFKNIYYEKQVDCNEQDVYTEIMKTSRSLISLYELEQFTNVSRLISRMKFDEEHVPEKTRKKELKKAENSNKKLESIAKNLKQLNDDDLMKQRITNMNSWNLSLEHILFLLQQIRLKNIELDDLLSSMRNISCCSSDFYTEYEKAMAMSE